jgi:class 3 adenylate cyclase/tetratricopeptide (TPR) repeat protein
MLCVGCQHENPDGARFCNACGAALEASCAACGQANPPGARFCNGCGAALGHGPAAAAAGSTPAEPTAGHLSDATDPRSYTPKHLAERILTQKSALEGERKHVTVLFADLADSTALAEHIGDPEETHSLLDRAFRLMLEQVHGVEGTINQFTGDGVMALFGAPVAIEDAPRRAVAAALAIQRALAPLDAEVQARHGRRFQMRIGIHSGPVVVGSIGDDLRMDYTAVGDTTNLAARIESVARAGTVVISESTARNVEGFFDLAPLPPVAVKGKSAPIQAYEVTAARAVAGRVDAAHSGEGLTAYVGRARELDMLMNAWQQAKAGHGQVAFVVGEAGLGKSRLLHEFRRRLQEREKPHSWAEGRCASFAQTTPFHAVADSIRRAHGIDDRDDEATALAKIEAREGNLGGELAWTLPYLRTLLSLPSGDPKVDALDPMRRRSEMCRALHARLVRVAGQVPAVLVIEDLHWLDAATEEFLSFLTDTVAAVPMLILLTHRPGYQHPFGDRSYHVRVPLQALDEAAMSSMVGSVLDTDDLPGALRELIARKAEGNPLFVEEVTTSLLEEGVLALEQGRVSVTRELADVAIPDRIQDVLMARLDRLPEEPKRAIQIASIIGREFAMRLLGRIHDAAGGLDSIVGELRSLELIYEKAAHPELAYMFKHALTHEVAYESVLVARRKVLHRVVGAAIEELYPDRLAEHYEALAYHFAASEDFEKAYEYHELASEKSAAAYANQAAIDHCQRAFELAQRLGTIEDERLLALKVRLGDCAWMRSEFGTSADAYLEAASLAPDPASKSLLMARASFSFLWDHDYDRARIVAADAMSVAPEAEATAGHAFALVTLDETDLVQAIGIDDYARVLRSVDVAERSGDVRVLVGALGQLGQRFEWQGDYRSCIAHCDRAVTLAGKNNTPGDALFASWFLGMASTCIGDYARGFQVIGNGVSLCEHIGDRAIQARLLNTLGWIHSEIGCYERAATFNRQGTELALEAVELGLVAGAPELYANAAINLSGNLLALGQIDESAEQLAPIQAQFENDPDPWMRWRWSTHLLHAKARLALAQGDPQGAFDLAHQELEAAGAAKARKLIARSHELIGRLHLELDDHDAAARALETALEISSGIEHPPIAWRAHTLLAEVARRRGDSAAVERHLAVFTRVFDALAPNIPDAGLREQFRAMGARLVDRPLAYP